MLKKSLCLLLCLLSIISCLTACGNDKTDSNPTTPNQTNPSDNVTEPTKDENRVEYYVDDKFESKICISFPDEIKDNYHTELSSSLKDGWYRLSFCLGKDFDGPSYYLFTVYCSKDDSYKKYEKEKNYEVVGTDGTYTLIWYEHNTTEGVTLQNVLSEIENFASHYKKIKSSLTIEK